MPSQYSLKLIKLGGLPNLGPFLEQQLALGCIENPSEGSSPAWQIPLKMNRIHLQKRSLYRIPIITTDLIADSHDALEMSFIQIPLIFSRENCNISDKAELA